MSLGPGTASVGPGRLRRGEQLVQAPGWETEVAFRRPAQRGGGLGSLESGLQLRTGKGMRRLLGPEFMSHVSTNLKRVGAEARQHRVSLTGGQCTAASVTLAVLLRGSPRCVAKGLP